MMQHPSAPHGPKALEMLTAAKESMECACAILLQSPVLAAAKPFVTGSLAGSFATCCVQPMDMIKLRVQLCTSAGHASSPMSIASQIMRHEGVTAMYTGLGAGLTRQLLYGSSRLGLYEHACEYAKSNRRDGAPLPLWTRAACALSAGAFAAVLANPADLALVRLQADSMLPAAERCSGSSLLSACAAIVRHEGVCGLLNGASLTASRAAALNLGAFVGFGEAKEQLQRAGLDGYALLVGASAIGGLLAAGCSLPFDYVKTIAQKQRPESHGVLPNKAPLECIRQTLCEGGLLRIYSTFPSYYLRIAPHAMITLVTTEMLKACWKRLGA